MIFSVWHSSCYLVYETEVAVTPVTSEQPQSASSMCLLLMTPSPVLTWPTGDLDIYKVLGYECSESRVSHPYPPASSSKQWLSDDPWPIGVLWEMIGDGEILRPSRSPCRTRDTEMLGGRVFRGSPGILVQAEVWKPLVQNCILLEFETQSGKASGLNKTQLLPCFSFWPWPGDTALLAESAAP